MERVERVERVQLHRVHRAQSYIPLKGRAGTVSEPHICSAGQTGKAQDDRLGREAP